MGRERSITGSMARFFVGMKELTAMPTAELAVHLGRSPNLKLPSKATLNDLCRRHGVRSDAPADRLLPKPRPLGTLRVQVFSGMLRGEDNVCRRCELALSYEPWSGAVWARVAASFNGLEELQSFVRSALGAFPPEYRAAVEEIALLHRRPVTVVGRSVLERGGNPLGDSSHSPSRIGLMRITDTSDYDGFRHDLPRAVASYNNYDPETTYVSQLGRRVQAPFREGFTGWGGPERLGNVAEVSNAMAGRGPARRVFAALSSIPGRKPGIRNPSTKYSKEQIGKRMTPAHPGRRARRRSEEPADRDAVQARLHRRIAATPRP